MTESRCDLKVVCSWCQHVIREGPDDRVSHGICGRCMQKYFSEYHPRAVFLARDDTEVYMLTNAREAWQVLKALQDTLRPYRDTCPDHVVVEEAGRLWDAIEAVLRDNGLDVDLALGGC